MSVHLFGIRHHGPGCARALLAALEELQPDCILVEGPPDAQDALPLLLHEHMVPPVALLIYRDDDPARAVYYPFTIHSPEWQALRFGLRQGIPTRFFDLPQSIQLARKIEEGRQRREEREGDAKGAKEEGEEDGGVDGGVWEDPLGMLAEAAGYRDHELWWEHQIEQRQEAAGLFTGILEAMTALRGEGPPRDPEDGQREAYMRAQLRAAEAEGFARIAVVCGAWHTPALISAPDTPVPVTAVAGGAEAHGRRSAAHAVAAPGTGGWGSAVAVTATWIPWTNARLSSRSGYGAGVRSPGWYEHLWVTPTQRTIRWLARVAQVLRMEGFDVSSANVIEAVRLAETLAALRDLPMPGLAELHEATLTVLCHGDEAPLRIIRDQLEIGERMGEVPPETPIVPLQRDLEARMRKLRLKPAPESKALDLDLREPNDLAKSHLLHQLVLLGIPWGRPQRTGAGKQGTFHELWAVRWEPEFAVRIIEANIWGNTVEIAAVARAIHEAEAAADLPQLTDLLQRVILASLPAAVDRVLVAVRTQAALAADMRHLMLALPPLATVARYSDVRQTRADEILPVIGGIFARVLVGLRTACAALDDDAAHEMAPCIDAVESCVRLLDESEQRSGWQAALRAIADDAGIHGLIRGQCCRLLLEARALDDGELERRARHAFSPATPAEAAAAWAEGVLRGGAEVLLHEDGLWRALDHWLRELEETAFVSLLPLLRRAFADFDSAARHRMGAKVKRLGQADTTVSSMATAAIALNRERADRTLPALARLLGVK